MKTDIPCPCIKSHKPCKASYKENIMRITILGQIVLENYLYRIQGQEILKLGIKSTICCLIQFDIRNFKHFEHIIAKIIQYRCQFWYYPRMA